MGSLGLSWAILASLGRVWGVLWVRLGVSEGVLDVSWGYQIGFNSYQIVFDCYLIVFDGFQIVFDGYQIVFDGCQVVFDRYQNCI